MPAAIHDGMVPPQMCYRSRNLIALLLAFALAFPCLGWGAEGHRISGAIAWHFLSDKAKAAVQDLLGDQSLGDAGCWADEIRSNRQYDWAKPLHYVNAPREAKTVSMPRDCKNGGCVLGAIDRFTKVLRDRTAPKEERAEALKFVIHFVQDVHQPLHVSYEDDRGGNGVKVTWMGRPTNLHYVWDNSIIEQRLERGDLIAMANQIRGNITDAQLKKWREGSMKPEDWADESLTITRRLYLDLPKDGALESAYYERNIGVVEGRLAAAGVRLAMLLNSIFGDTPTAATEPATTSADTQPSTTPSEEDAASFIEIVAGDPCGTAGGKTMYLVNNHDSRMIRVKVRRSWAAKGKPATAEQVVTVRAGEGGRKELGCSAVKPAGGEPRTFEWTIVEAKFPEPS